MKMDEPKTKADELKTKTDELRTKADELKMKTDETKTKTGIYLLCKWTVIAQCYRARLQGTTTSTFSYNPCSINIQASENSTSHGQVTALDGQFRCKVTAEYRIHRKTYSQMGLILANVTTICAVRTAI
jgi:hypothetical protein